MSFGVALLCCSLSYLEHVRSIRPSTILIGYLLFSTIFDIVRCRTLWLVAPASPLTRLFTTSTALKAVTLVLEAVEKARYLPRGIWEGRPEETSSILNRSIFYWLNRFMIRGSRHLILPEDLYELDYKLTTNRLAHSYITNWQRLAGTSRHAALYTTFKTLKSSLVITVFPRIILLALTMCQPLLIHKLLHFLTEPIETRPKNVGYGLIVAYALVYIGTAIANGFYWQLHYRLLVMVRGCLVYAVSWQTAKLNIQATQDPKAAVTLMSADVQRIMDGLRQFHDFWASTLQICIAVYLLQKQMGVACVVPIVMSLLCTAIAACMSAESNKRQVAWMEAVQARIGVTSAMLSSIEGVKMRGLIKVFADTIRNYRAGEIKRGNAWRRILLWTIGISYVPEWMSPVATFTVYIIQARSSGQTFDAARGFTTLSLLIIMTQPMNGLVQSIPDLVSTVGCFRRIGEYLSSEEQLDFRTIAGVEEVGESPRIVSNSDGKGFSESIEMTTKVIRPLTNKLAKGQHFIEITEGSFGWTKDNAVLKSLNICFPKGCLTMIIGPVASGKSTLCKTILGETYASKGQLKIFATSNEVAFCDQTCQLFYGTVRDNIVGFGDFDEAWYEVVLQACALKADVVAMPNQNDTPVGSGGVTLSGGQRQKVALARALYARRSIIVLDDISSGLDPGSEQHVFHNVIGPNGLAQQQGITVIFASNALRFLSFAEHIICLGSDGRVVQQGSYEFIRSQLNHVHIPLSEGDSHDQIATTAEVVAEVANVETAAQLAKDDINRQLGDFAIYRYYFGAAGLTSTILMLTFGLGCSAFFNLSTLWLQIWINAGSKSGRRNDSRYLGVYGVFQSLSVVFLVLTAYAVLILIIRKTGTNLHENLLRTVTSASLAFFSATDKGSIMNRFSQDIQLIDMQLPQALVALVTCALTGTGQIILVVAASPWTGVTLPMVLIIFYFLQKFYLRTSRQLRLLDLEAKSPLYTNFFETLSGLVTIRAFGWTKENLALSQRLLDQSQRPIYLLYMIQRWLTLVIDMVIGCLAIIIVGLAVSQPSNGAFTGVALTQVMLVNLTLRGLVLSWTEVETSIGAVHRVKDFSENTPLEEKPPRTNQPTTEWPQAGKIEFKGVTAAYETALDRPALNNLNLDIWPGEKLGVCGRSGSGKSSLVLTLLRMLDLRSGAIRIDDVDIQDVSGDTIRERLNIIPQHPLIIPGTVRSNLDPSNEHSDTTMIDALKRTQMWPIFAAEGGLDSVVRSEVLSHGQRQLFCLTAAILRNPRVVILDEFTSK